MFGLNERNVNIVQSVGKDHPVVVKMLIYGSRARGSYRNGSDVDIALVGNEVTPREVARISSLLNEELPTPYFYDVIHYDSIVDEDFKKRIAEEGKVIYERI